MPFDIPDSWTWIRLKSLCEIIFSGKSPKYSKEKTNNIAIGQAANNGTCIDYSLIKYCTDEFVKDMPEFYYLRENDVLLNTLGHGTLGRCGIFDGLKDKVLTDGHLFVFRTFDDVTSLLLHKYLYLNRTEIEKSSNGTTNQIFLSLTTVGNYLFPLPPLKEQERIITKLQLCEPLIAQYSVTEAKLSILEEEFPEKLKKSILQYAIEGKLVKQDPNDEPASVLLERIKAEKERLIKEGKIKRDKNESYIYQADDKNYYENFLFYYHSFDIPSGWEICKLVEITEFIHRGKSPVYSSNKEIPVIAQKCNQKDGSLSLEKALFIDPASLCKYDKTKISKPNDIIVNSTGTGTVGRVNILNASLFEKYQTIVTDSHVTTIRPDFRR